MREQAELFDDFSPENPLLDAEWERPREGPSGFCRDPADGARQRAFRVWREFDRLRGLLRFKPDCPPPPGGPTESGDPAKLNKTGPPRYTARCAPDYFVLPLLAGHFARRFGNIPWAIIDEKRRIVLSCDPGETPRLARLSEKELPAAGEYDGWEKLWRNYFRSAANESRLNPGLQKQFMPRRYWEYLSELGEEKV